MGWSCPNKVVRLIGLFPETDIYRPGGCGKADESELPNRFPIEDSFSESGVGKYGWEGREVEQQDWAEPDWRSRETAQPWLPVIGTYSTALPIAI